MMTPLHNKVKDSIAEDPSGIHTIKATHGVEREACRCLPILASLQNSVPNLASVAFEYVGRESYCTPSTTSVLVRVPSNVNTEDVGHYNTENHEQNGEEPECVK